MQFRAGESALLAPRPEGAPMIAAITFTSRGTAAPPVAFRPEAARWTFVPSSGAAPASRT